METKIELIFDQLGGNFKINLPQSYPKQETPISGNGGKSLGYPSHK